MGVSVFMRRPFFAVGAQVVCHAGTATVPPQSGGGPSHYKTQRSAGCLLPALRFHLPWAFFYYIDPARMTWEGARALPIAASTLSLQEERAMSTSPALVVSLHDVSPLTRPACAAILAELASLGVPQTSLLVVPNHHRRSPMLEDAGFGEWLRAQAAAGHEIVIHGYHHTRERRPDESLRARLTTRFYTADEGEFYDLDRASAGRLVTQASAEFRQLGLAPTGFIAPAWLLSGEAEAALREFPCEYTTRLGDVLDLRNGQSFPSQSLVWSVRSAWRRQMSLAWNALLFHRLAQNPLLRISIHPVDLAHAKVWQQIRELIMRALAVRAPLTYLAWLTRQRAATPT